MSQRVKSQRTADDFQSVQQIIDELVRRAEARRWNKRAVQPQKQFAAHRPLKGRQLAFDFEAVDRRDRLARGRDSGSLVSADETADEMFERLFPEPS